MKTIITIIIYFCCSVSIFAAFDGGTGTATSPYLITTRAHLEELSDSVINTPYILNHNWSRYKHFKVMNDITDSLRVCIGLSTTYDKFEGVFDGNGKKITLAIRDY